MTVGEVSSTLHEAANDISDTKAGRSFSPDRRADVKREPGEISERKYDPDRRIDAATVVDERGKDTYNPDKRIEQEPGDVDVPKVEYDDTGKPYKIDGKMIPNCQYEINGYSYKTDGHGRRISAEGNLHLKQHEGRLPIKATGEEVGGKDHKKGSDDRGHMVGDQFGGSNGVENLVSMDKEINQKDFNDLERKLANALKAGSEVYYKFDVKYSGDSQRPSKFVVTYTIDGEKGRRVFNNEPGGAR